METCVLHITDILLTWVGTEAVASAPAQHKLPGLTVCFLIE